MVSPVCTWLRYIPIMSHYGEPKKQGIHDELASHKIFGYDLSRHPSHVQLGICMTGVIVLYLFYGYFQVRCIIYETFITKFPSESL